MKNPKIYLKIMSDMKDIIEELIQTVEGFEENNEATINDVKTWAEYWRKRIAECAENPTVKKCCLDWRNRKFKSSENGIEWYCSKCGNLIEV